MQARRARVTRGVLAAVVSTFAAAFSHGVAASQAPSVAALAAASVLAVFVCIGLAGRATPLRLAAAVLVSQAGFHALFALIPSATASTVSAATHHGMVTLTTDAVTHGHGSTGAAMWLGHATAALVTILALTRGERAFFSIVDALRLTVRALIGVLASHPVLTAAPIAPAWPSLLSLTPALLWLSLRRRGPPTSGRALVSFA